METAMSVLRQMPETKEQINSFSEKILNSVLEGEVNPMETEVLLRALDEVIKTVRANKDFKELIQDEADKYPEKTFKYKSVEVTKMNRGNFDFTVDQIWMDLVTKKKQREAFLKSIPEGEKVATEFGELVERPPKKITNYLTYKFK